MAAAQAFEVRAIGPAWSKLGASGQQPSSDTSPWVGLKPTVPVQAAGMRTEPPLSVPIAASARPAASAAALPPLDPPGVRSGAIGLGTQPKWSFSLVTPHANSCRLVFPTLTYPPASRSATAGAVASGTWSAKIADPYVVRTPAVSKRSLTASR